MKAYLKLLSLALLVTAYMVIPNIAKADSAALNKFGVCDHLASYSDQQVASNEIIASGMQWVRTDAPWANIETSKGVYSAAYLAKLDDIVNTLSAQNVNIVFVLDATALWASSPANNIFAPPANQSDWASFVSFITARYNNKVFYWEIWNEPDYGGWDGTVAQYVTLMQTAAPLIRAANPNNKILMGGLACATTPAPGGFFDTELSLGAANYFDIINYHSYGTHQVWRNTWAGMQSIINKYSLQTRPIWITETGYSTGGDTTLEPAKAQYLEAAYYSLFAFSPNIQKIFMYVHRNTDTGNAVQDNFGLLTNSTRTPLLPFYHYQAMDGAEADFEMQTAFPSTEYRRTLNYVVTTTGDGQYITNYVPDGSSKQIQAGTYMYFGINDMWLYNVLAQDKPIYIDVTYLDSGTGTWGIQYSGASSAYEMIQTTLTNTGKWLTKTFTLPDAKFANNENYASDFRIFTESSNFIVSDVNVRQGNAMAWAVLGVTDPIDQSWLMWRPESTTTTASSYNPVATIGGTVCREILDSAHFIYFDVADSLVPPTDPNVTISFTYWDSGTDNIMLSYNAIGKAYKNIYVAKTNTSTWKTYKAVISDANFVDGQDNIGDFSISDAGQGDVDYVSQVTITSP